MKNRTISTTVTATVSEDGKNLIISLPMRTDDKRTKNGKSFIVAETGEWPQNWVSVDVGGNVVGLTVCALVADPEHPDNQPKVVAPPVVKAPRLTTVKSNGNGTTTKAALNGKRIMPSNVS